LLQPYFRLHGTPRKSTDAPEIQRDIHLGIRLLQACTTYQPDNWSAHWITGKAHQCLGDHQSAYPSFKHAFEVQKQNADVAREYMFTCLQLGYADEGVRAATHAINLDPANAGLHANLALARMIAGQSQEALAAVEDSLRLDPNDRISKNIRTLLQEILAGRRASPRTLSELES
jgi:tetratricopeptide (TPR) repeat protein